MDAFLLKGPVRLLGTVRASGAKNAALPALAAALLTDAPVILDEVPDLADVDTMDRLLAGMGVSIDRPAPGRMVLDASRVTSTEAPYDLVRRMRASILVLGPLVARFGEARVSLPGGCAIGVRPVDLHLMALEAMGARIAVENGYIHAHVSRVGRGTDRLTGTTIRIHTPTVTGPENVPDRIEAGTYLAAGAITRGDVTVTRARARDLEAFLDALRRAGVGVEVTADAVRVFGGRPLEAVDIETAPHPGFPTDLQAQFLALMTQAKGTSRLVETIFENRFLHAVELARLGADVRVDGRAAIVRGPTSLEGAPVTASDLRASAALVLAGLVARGETRVRRIYHLDRGYAAMDERLRSLGASVERIDG